MRLLWLTMIVSLYCISSVVALEQVSCAAAQEMKHDSSQPVNITANKLEADDKAGVFVFIGDVQAQQGDLFIYAQKMTVHYSEKKAQDDGGKRQIDKVVAEKDVRIVQLNRVATGQKGVFYHQEGRIVLTGDPRVVQGDNNIAGERIVVYLNEDRSIVEGGGKQRVKAVFVPEEKK